MCIHVCRHTCEYVLYVVVRGNLEYYFSGPIHLLFLLILFDFCRLASLTGLELAK